MTKPKISVVIPCYNQELYLDECLQSVQEQTYTEWEAIIVNDGSTDLSAEIAKQRANSDARFQLITTENRGVSHARNVALQAASGKFIQFLDADDLLSRRNFEKKIAHSADAEVILSDFNIYRNKRKIPGYNKLRAEYLEFDSIFYDWELKFTIPIHSALISRALLRDFAFDTSLRCFEDWLMWLHIAQKNPKTTFLNEALVSYRKEHNVDTASSDLKQVIAEKMKVLPLLKKIYGEEKHDAYIYHVLETRSRENHLLKKEIRKILDEKLVSKYLKLKRFYYKAFNK